MLTDSRTQTTSGEPARTAPATEDWPRLLAAAAVAGGASVMVMVGLWVTGVVGSVGGWFWSALAMAAAAGGAGWIVMGPHRGRMAVVAGATIAGVAAGMWLAAIAPLGHGRLWAAMDEVFPRATVAGFDSEAGNAICFDECPAVSRTWDAPGTSEEVQAGVAEALRAGGYEVGSWDRARAGGEGMELEGHRGRVSVVAGVHDGPVGAQVTVSMATYRGGG